MGSTGTFGDPITSDQASAFVNYYLGSSQTGTSKDFGIVNNVTTGSGSCSEPIKISSLGLS